MKTIRLLLADDHAIIREGIRTLFDRQEDMEVVGEATDGLEALNLARELAPDMVIMDISMPRLNGVDATRKLLAELAQVRVIALSMHSDLQFVSEMLKAGALGYLLKDCVFEELIQAVHVVRRGKTYLSPEVAGGLVQDYLCASGGKAACEGPALSGREREVLQLIAEGHPTKNIADMLHVSVKTVETHRAQMMKKLNVNSLAELTKYAIRTGLTSL